MAEKLYYDDDAASSSSLSLEGSVYENYINAIRSKVTQRNYTFAIKKYLQFMKVTRLEDLLTPYSLPNDLKLIEANIISYIVHLKNTEKVGRGTINAYIAAIMLFYAVCADLNLNRRKIARYLPDSHKMANDRPYSTEEIQKMIDGANDIRVRALIYLLSSTGIRIGSTVDLKLKHLHKNEKYNLYKIIVYAGYKEEYFVFTTVEAAAAIQTYLDFRTRLGEQLTPESYLFVQQTDISDPFSCRHPKKMRLRGITKSVRMTAIRSGVVQKAPLLEGQKKGTKRNSVYVTHAFRKRYTNILIESGVSSFAVERLLGHLSRDVTSKHYYRPTEELLLEEYATKAMENLTISSENRLKKQVEQLTIEKSHLEKIEDELTRLASEVYRLGGNLNLNP